MAWWRYRALATLTALALAGLALAVPASGVASSAVPTPRPAATAPPAAGAPGAAVRGTPAKVSGTKRPASHVPTSIVPLSGWLGNGTTFPNQALVLTGRVGITADRVHVSENGTAVSSVTLTSSARARAGDFGVMLVIDQSSSMSGAPLAAAIAAARSFAAQRRAQQELGLVTFDAQPNVILPLTGNLASIRSSLGSNPWTGAGADVPAAAQLALAQLAISKVALGALVVISDGVGDLTPPGGPTPTSVQAVAAAAHVPIFTVGLRDSASSATSLQALAAASPGQFVSSSPAQLPSTLRSISSALTRGYVVRYRSRQPLGQAVAVTATVDGVPGAIHASYRAPAPHLTPPARRSGRSGPVRGGHVSGLGLARAARLSRWPDFVSPPPAAVSPPSFWATAPGIPIVAMVCGLLIGLAIMLAVRRPSQRGVRTRVGKFIPGPELVTDGGPLQPSRGPRRAPRLLERGSWWAPFVENVEVARGTHTPVELVKRAAIIGVVMAVLVTVASGSVLIGIVPLLLWPLPLKMIIGRAARKQRAVFIDTLPGYLQDLASALRVGRSFASALAVVAATADEPVRSELERAVTDEALGRPLEESLVAVGQRMQSTDVDQVALIASLNRRSGSNVAEALDRVAEGARDRADMRREVKALTGQAKMSSWVLTSLPPLLLVMVSIISPLYAHPLFHTTLGVALLITSGLMVLGGWKVMKKITEIKA